MYRPRDVASHISSRYGIYVPTETIRKYEKIAGINPKRVKGEERRYSLPQCEQLEMIVIMRNIGIPFQFVHNKQEICRRLAIVRSIIKTLEQFIEGGK